MDKFAKYGIRMYSSVVVAAWNGTHHIGAHTSIESQPALFPQNGFGSP